MVVERAFKALRLVAAASRMQFRLSRRRIEDFFPLLTLSLSATVAIAVLVNSGREDLVGYALVAAVLMGMGQMSFFVGSEILANERREQILENLIVAPSGYFVPLLSRVTALTVLGSAGFAIAWVVARIVFGVSVRVHHPWVLLMALLATVFAAAATAVGLCALFCFGRTTRTYQNAISGPLYLLSGVLVPVDYLPEVVQPLSRVIFLYWSAGLLRDSLQPAPIIDLPLRFGGVVLPGLVGGLIGFELVRRLLEHLRREGTIGL